MELDHIGLVTNTPDPLVQLCSALGYIAGDVGTSHGCQCHFFSAPGQPTLEIVVPDDNEPLRRFADTSKTALHHLAYRTDDLAAEVQRWKELGYAAITEEAQPGARDKMRVVFLRPKSDQHLLIEIVSYGI